MAGKRSKPNTPRAARTATGADTAGPGLTPWSELIGHEQAIAAWRSLSGRGSLPQVLLMVGRAGLGKRSLLRLHAAFEVCTRQSGCGQCAPCQAVLADRHPDVFNLDPAEHEGRLTIEDAGRFQEFLALSPGPGARARTALIADADSLTQQAANRLLKTLEEPPEGARIVLSTARPGALLDTVRSRCVVWRLVPVQSARLEAWLTSRLGAEAVRSIGPSALTRLIRQAGMAPGAALAAAERWLKGAAGEGDAQREWEALLRDPAATVVGLRRQAGALVREKGLGIEAMLAGMEFAINDEYAEALEKGLWPAVREIAARRQVLRRTRAIALGAHVALNAQLAAEALALADRGCSGG